ncbi:MAG: TOBE domain-containing protein [Desulfuromonadales bacterium]|nr:TOBE domain-containing protein [Desulfuromonadales bacterium]
MKISTRNVLNGKVTAIKRGAVNSEVEMTIAGGHRIVAIITNESVEALGLINGRNAFALIKAPLVAIGKDIAGMKFSTRNILEGTIKDITHGSVNGGVTIDLPGGNLMEAIVTEHSIAELKLKVNDTVTAFFKASHVIVAVTD